MVRLSVNINKFATLRNARGGNVPDVCQVGRDCERFGADGITVHPRPDQRHIRYADVWQLAPLLTTEFNIEGNPIDEWMDVVLRVRPAQATLVPDSAHALTSSSGWDTWAHQHFLRERISELRKHGIRTSIFVNPFERMIEGAKQAGADRIELFTGPYAHDYVHRREEAVKPYIRAAQVAHRLGLGVNAGHDLNLQNLKYFVEQVPYVLEVSIGHALICDAIYLGLENTIQLYKRQLLSVSSTAPGQH